MNKKLINYNYCINHAKNMYEAGDTLGEALKDETFKPLWGFIKKAQKDRYAEAGQAIKLSESYK